MADNRRSIKNLFVDSNLAARFGILLLISWSLVLTLTIGSQYFITKHLESTLAEQVRLPDQATVLFGDYFLMSSVIQVVLFMIFAWVLLAFVTLMNHRIYGPLGTIKEFIACLKSGNYDPPKKSLREKDEFVSVMNELNELADTLKQSN